MLGGPWTWKSLGCGYRRSFQSGIELVELGEDMDLGIRVLDDSGWRGGCPGAYV